jgi:hypothetical protein
MLQDVENPCPPGEEGSLLLKNVSGSGPFADGGEGGGGGGGGAEAGYTQAWISSRGSAWGEISDSEKLGLTKDGYISLCQGKHPDTAVPPDWSGGALVPHRGSWALKDMPAHVRPGNWFTFSSSAGDGVLRWTVRPFEADTSRVMVYTGEALSWMRPSDVTGKGYTFMKNLSKP